MSVHPVPPSASRQSVDVVPREARTFQGHRAGIVTRVIANTVDFAVTVGVLAGLFVGWCALRFLISPTSFTWPSPSFLAWLIAGGSILWLYFTASWGTTGRTLGNHLLGLRVVNFRGGRLRWLGAALRALFCVFVPIGLFWVVVSGANRSVQDVVLRTSVIYDWTTRARIPARQAAVIEGEITVPVPGVPAPRDAQAPTADRAEGATRAVTDATAGPEPGRPPHQR